MVDISYTSSTTLKLNSKVDHINQRGICKFVGFVSHLCIFIILSIYSTFLFDGFATVLVNCFRIDDSGMELENPRPDHVAFGSRVCLEVGLFCKALAAIKSFSS